MKWVITAALICAATQKINNSNELWNSHDDKVLLQAQKRCEILYKNSPCLSKLIKVQCNDDICFHAYCGEKK